MGTRVRVLVVTCTALVCPCLASRPQSVRREYVELHMGVGVRIVLYASDDGAARRAARAAYDRIVALEDIMSDYRPQSEVRRLAERAGEAVPVSEHLFTVLARALDLSRRSNGAFDPTVGPFVELWRAVRRTGRLPAQPELDAARARVGWEKVRLDSAARTVRLEAGGMRLDLGGIAKGYILDQALAELRRNGVTRALLEAGGDIVAGDAPPGRSGWRVTVPAGGPAIAARAKALAHAALATSGDTEQFVVVDGVRYSHVVDPRTGLGVTGRRQATVVASDGLTADGLATALVLLDDSATAALLREFPAVVAETRIAH